MFLNSSQTIQLRSGNTTFSFLRSGDLHSAISGNILLNQVVSNAIDGSMNNIYLRIYDGDEIDFIPLTGIQSESEFFYSALGVCWKGNYKNVEYELTFTLAEENIWFWNVKLQGQGVIVDVIYGQDLGLSDIGMVRNNEAYASQYIDHKIFADPERGYVVCSRQNLPQSTGNPYLQQGALSKVVGYSTDGFQFFGKTFKETHQPEALMKKKLANENYQYEMAYIALQSEKLELNGVAEFTYYGVYQENHPEAVHTLEFGDKVKAAWERVKDQKVNYQKVEQIRLKKEIGTPLETKAFTKDEIDELYPQRMHEEWEDGKLLAFFTDTREHVVLKDKELLVERPHGHIMMGGNDLVNIENTITTTSFMYGIFNSHIAIGNTDMNKFISTNRNVLNYFKTSGQRIYVWIDGAYHLLTMPSLFEIGFNYTRWYYKTDFDVFVVTNFTATEAPEIHLSVRSLSNKPYRYLVTTQVTMNKNEYQAPYEMEIADGTLLFTAGEGADSKNVYPDLSYKLSIVGTDYTVTDEQALADNADSGSASLVVLKLAETPKWRLIIQGSLNGQFSDASVRDEKVEIENYRKFIEKTMNGFRLSLGDETPESIERFNTLAWWYTHNMLVHYSVPHGLEQYSGAAWGTRDVCQGPAEYFLATGHYDVVKHILKVVYSHQYEEDGNWPQWFMFDGYRHIQAGESHGDIVVWPLKLLSDYLLVTGDYHILDERVPFTKRSNFQFTDETYTIREHVQKEIDYITKNFLHDTYLSSYGDGDWEDTLQPANQKLKRYMASSWTIALTYQAMKQFATALEKVDTNDATKLHELADHIKSDFIKYMAPSEKDVVPGFLYMENPDQPVKLLHPDDKETGIKYRLIPMYQSIISEVFTLKQAENHYQIIKEHLTFPDGVRLVNKPVQYTGGVSRYFQRAEQAANFGREIGMLYIHAHIRYIEAMAKLGKAEEAWHGLEIINPVDIKKYVGNADFRQSNTYFSSSDANFKTRYEAQENFNQVRTGSIPVKAGWRIYSSGPGIYMNQLISNILGLRLRDELIIFDPVLPGYFDGLQFSFKLFDKPVTFKYHFARGTEKVTVNGKEVKASRLKEYYRDGGFIVSRNELEQLLTEQDNIIRIDL